MREGFIFWGKSWNALFDLDIKVSTDGILMDGKGLLLERAG